MRKGQNNTRITIAACFMLLFALKGFAQEINTGDDQVILEGKEVEVKKSNHSPKRATLMSVILPGLGQAYNKKYWKIPIVYAGLGTTVYFIFWNQGYYNDFSDAFDIRQAGGIDKYYEIYSSQNLITLQNYYRNNRDLSIILTVAVYGLQILDANIDAHLFDFDVSEDISLRLEPGVLSPIGMARNNFGMRMTFQF